MLQGVREGTTTPATRKRFGVASSFIVTGFSIVLTTFV
jgi:hypothetical protein